MSGSKVKSNAVKTPDDPDPTPITQGDSSAEIQGAARNEKKKMAGNFGRKNTILAGNTMAAGNTAADNSTKKTILGG